MVLAASLLSAGLASTATSLLERDAGATSSATTTNTSATVTTAVAGTTSGTVVGAAAAVSPAVVTITTTSSAQAGPFASGGGVGSGFVFAADGWILTNAHVVEGASSLTVTLDDGRTFDGRVVTSDADADLAVVKVEATGLPVADLGSSADVVVGQTVIAIGSPLGTYDGTVTTGVISGIGRSVTVADDQARITRDLVGLLQTDAAVNEGNSGGPLVTLAGTVIGVVTAGSTSTEGIGFAIPIDAAAAIMAEATGTLQQG
jgi:S1-C subfamily serine protease